MRIRRLSALLLVVALTAGNAEAAKGVLHDPLGSSQWRYMARKFFKDATVVFDDRVKVVAPAHAEDPLATPVQVSAPELVGVRHVLVFADLIPVSRVLDYDPVWAKPAIGFSVKIQQATPIRAAMRTADGVWHVGGTWVDAQGGGCTVPNVGAGDPSRASHLGETRARLWPLGEDTERLKVRVVHPMDTGQAAGRPAFYIDGMRISDAQGNVLARLKPHEMISQNPVFTLDLDHRGAVAVSGRDNEGNRFSARVPVPAW